MITTIPALNYAQKNKDAPLSDIQTLKITGDIKDEEELFSSHRQKLAGLTRKPTKHYWELVYNSRVWGESK